MLGTRFELYSKNKQTMAFFINIHTVHKDVKHFMILFPSTKIVYTNGFTRMVAACWCWSLQILCSNAFRCEEHIYLCSVDWKSIWLNCMHSHWHIVKVRTTPSTIEWNKMTSNCHTTLCLECMVFNCQPRQIRQTESLLLSPVIVPSLHGDENLTGMVLNSTFN